MAERSIEILLRLLDSTIEVRTTERWEDLLRSLWSPFLMDPSGAQPDFVFELSSDGDTYEAGFVGQESFRTDDPWLALLRLRVCLGRASMDAAGHLHGLHGAFLQTGSGALILSGSAGAGKSTLSAELALGGVPFGGDDLVGVDLAQGKITPLPLPPAFKDVTLFSRFEHLWRIPTWMPPCSSAFVVPPSVFPAVVTQAAPLAAVAFLSRGEPGPAAVDDVAPAEGIVAFAEEGDRLEAGDIRRLVVLLGAADTFRLRYGSTTDAVELLRMRMALTPTGK